MDFPDLFDPSDLGIHFFFEEVDFDWKEALFSDWLVAVIKEEAKVLQSVRYIFCKDAYLHEINVAYLNHDTLTDVITFPYATIPIINGEIYISTDRIAENAATFGVSFQQELARVMVHGVLHLCGYGDKEIAEKTKMRRLEEYYMKKLEAIISSK